MYQAIILTYFKRQLKPHLKKHRDLKQAVIDILSHFDKRQYDYLGGGIYKIRLKTKSLLIGKNKSFRLIVLVMEVERLLMPITIYFKGDAATVSKKELNQHLQNFLFELRTRTQG